MAGLNHDFLLLSSQEHSYFDYLKWINNPQAILIHDDIMNYIQDSLNWITCYNPGKKMVKHKGLNFCGPTVIKKDGAIAAYSIFKAWASLFSCGPKRLRLTGSYGWIAGESKETGSYSIVKADRDEMVEKFNVIANYSKQVVDSKDQLFILHLGM